VALVLATPGGPRGARLVALDLADGDVVWDEHHDGDPAGLRAVAGRLVHVDAAAHRLVVHG
jgi:outer membrane protein assembly factor BamB